MELDQNEVMEKFFQFIKTECSQDLGKLIITGKKSLIIDFTKFDAFEPDIAQALIDNPSKYLDIFEDALVQFEEGLREKVFVRFINLPINYYIKIRDIRSKHLGKFLYTEGIVRQASAVRPTCTLIIYKCSNCEQKISVIQDVTEIKQPDRCPNCGARRFDIIKNKLVDTQRLVLEESSESLEGGQPMRLNIILKNDLVEPQMVKKTNPGSKVKIIGVVNEYAKNMPGTSTKSVIYDIMLEANNIESIEKEYEEIDVTQEDIEQIELLSKDPDIYNKLIRSVSPSIKGRSQIKEALALQMFGGVRKERTDGTKGRGDIHILLIGDPGTGKSQLVKSMSTVAPKARFVSGKGATGAGLTATVVKDEILRGWALEAGALVLANKGILCIDEIDKMSQEDRSAMHEAMEQQTVSISKANVQAVLNCQTSILAAANPKLGRFDGFKPLPEQIDMPITLLSRFDLIFPFRDMPDKESDKSLAEFILKSHQNMENYSAEIPAELLRKYVSYARQNVSPKLSDEAIEEIQNFFVNLRNKEVVSTSGPRPVPLTPRQLEALVRISEASAKVRLSKQVTLFDAKKAINLMKLYLSQLGMDPETQELDIDRVMSGTTSSQRSRIYEVMEIIKRLEKSFGKDIPLEEIMNEVRNKGIDELKAEEIIEKMIRTGELFKPRHGVIRRINK
ncbi:MAG: minichromosome maintenance protein MCM [Candidatus Nanoarchaeia archaeon]|nr:minichromosome maintenance protein MCM [Candidatus Nanoarchaeia archaeon]MDD5054422.1 minichromosome maintenance protein MCM [Candidatus Nanoarchaeia archaeon]MDD5499772.1 minichromosome maintenance protein MCM [Candidatus Nanoarchaeia archaeon]